MTGYKYKCKICSDGRLYDGGWIHESVVPRPLPFNEMIFDDFPENANGGSDYLWNGVKLLYDPQPVEDAAT